MSIRSSLLILCAQAVAACGGDEGPARCADAGVVTYSHVEPVFSRCVRCHSTDNVGEARNGAPTYINLNSYNEIIKISRQALRAMGTQFMPPVGDKVPRCEWMLVGSWIDQGMQP